MKTLRKLTAAAFLACALALSASAGDIHTGGYAPPLPEPPPDSKGAPNEAPEETGDVLSEVIASLLSGLLTVL